MKIALVHDWLNELGGAERVLIELHKIFPKAPIYALFVNKGFTNNYLKGAEIKTSELQKVPFIIKLYRYLFFLMPSVVESFDLSDFDVVISSSVIFSKGLVLKPKTRHICYCYSPTRQLWDLHSSYKSWPQKIVQHLLRVWDRQAADRVDEFVAISQNVQSRIKKYYGKGSKLIYPPVNTELASQKNNSELNKHKNYYLIVSRLFPHKNIDIAINAFNKLGYDLLIIGKGPDHKNLKSKIANPKQIRMLGFVPDKELPQYYADCKAFIMPQEEDFGLTPIEAMSFGKPVLALRKGGALETITEGVTGEFFDDPIPEALADGVRRLNNNFKSYNLSAIKKQADKFSKDKFRNEILSLVDNKK